MIDENKRNAIKDAIRSAMAVRTGIRGGERVITLPPVFVKSEPPTPVAFRE